VQLSISSILEVAIGLALIYYVLSLVVSYLSSKVLQWSEIRAATLEAGLADLLKDPSLLQSVWEHPLIRLLRPQKLSMIGSAKKTLKVEEIASDTFSMVFLSALTAGVASQPTLADIQQAIAKLPDGDLKKSLTEMLNSGVATVQEMRSRIERWFDDMMAGVSALYKQHARRIVIFISLAVTLLLGVDSIHLARFLYLEPIARNALVEQANQIIEQQGAADQEALKYLARLQAAEIPLIWSAPLPAAPQEWLLKILGLLITWGAIAQGASFWYQNLKKLREVTTGKGQG
jgi:hypothetical protein